jgi:Fe-S oxidoreductase
VYEAPRKALEVLDADLVELKRCKSNGLCCGAGGAQMFKEPEAGNKDINIERTEEILAVKPQIVAAGCPFCMTMLSDGIKNFDKEKEVEVLDIAEITVRANGL